MSRVVEDLKQIFGRVFVIHQVTLKINMQHFEKKKYLQQLISFVNLKQNKTKTFSARKEWLFVENRYGMILH